MLFIGILILLISNAVTFRRDKSILFARLSIIILINCMLLLSIIISYTFFSISISLYGGLINCKYNHMILTLFIFAITIFILSLSSFYPRKILFLSIPKISYEKKNKIINNKAEQFRLIEYPLIILFVLTGAIFLISSSDLVTIFLAIELQSYGLYLLASIYRNSELSTNAGLSYFLLGGLSSCFILLGQSLLYINSGTTNLENIFIIENILVNNRDIISNISKTTYGTEYFIQMSYAVISLGLLFKISSAPFHFWSPMVYDSLPTIVTTFVAIVGKLSILMLLLQLLFNSPLRWGTNDYLLEYSWRSNIILSSFLSLIIGCLLGLTQFRIKRLLAYSTISHIGFILLALSINSIESLQAFFFYLIQYSITNLNAFILLISIGYSFYEYNLSKNIVKGDGDFVVDNKKQLEKNLSPIQLTLQLKGFFYINPLLAISLAITLFSLIGVPPLLGFFAKQMILSSALDNGYYFMSILAILTSAISAVYYLVVIKEIFFFKSNYKSGPLNKNSVMNNNYVCLSSSLTLKISILTLIILLFIFYPIEILTITNIMSLYLY